MTTTRKLIIGCLLCLLASPVFAGGYEIPEQPPMEHAPIDQSGSYGQSGGMGHGQCPGQPVESSPTQQSDGCTQGYPGQPGQGGYGSQYGQGQPSYADFQALVMMLNLVLGDLEMCQMSLRSNPHYLNDVMSIGYLNNAKSALSRTVMHPVYMPLLAEIDQRLSKIKFHLVMNDERNVRMMIAQLSAMMRSIIASQGGTQVQYSQPTGTGITSTGTGVTVVTVYPAYPRIIIHEWGQGQNINPPSQGIPSTLTPVSDGY